MKASINLFPTILEVSNFSPARKIHSPASKLQKQLQLQAVL